MLRNMTGIYLSCGNQLLLLYRQGSRVVNNLWIASAGGHFEPEELNDPERCVLRELKEELNLTKDDLTGMKLRYIGLRNTNNEIRQNYYFFADLKPEHYGTFVSEEGKCRWVGYEDVLNYEMPLTAKRVMEHFMTEGRYTDKLYAAVSGSNGFEFVEIRDAET